ncbi:MAG: S8 family peptidase [Aestuariivirga sp.]
MEKFIVLRDLSFNRPRRQGPFSGPMSMPRPEDMAAPAAPVIEVGEMKTSEAKALSRDPTVLGVTRSIPTKLVMPTGTATPSATTTAWGVTAVGAANSTATGAGVKVAVLDTGIDASHPAFAGVNLDQHDFSGDGNGDVQGHGTHCAGTIFGRDVNGTRIGVARGVTDAMIGKVLGNTGSGDSAMIFQGIQWAVNGGAKVISMSLGFDFPGLVDMLINQQNWPADIATSAALEGYRANLRMFDALMAQVRASEAFSGGVVLVAASGNESRREISPNHEVSVSIPAAAEGIVSVGALGQSTGGLTIANFSNTGPVLSGPGVAITSAKKGGGLVDFNGTSMATPHVAGCAALWWERMGALGIPATAPNVVARLRATASTTTFAPGVDMDDRGAGIVQSP